MNRCYRLVWNRNSEKWVVAHEHARSRGKRSGALRLVATAAAAALAGFAASAQALPTGGQVSAGTGSIAQSGTAMTVSQGSRKLALNWQSFGIGADESVTFRQPDSSAIALNRVLGTDPSQIYGRLSANGQVFLLNPNGLLFGPGAQVNVGGLVASTLNLSDSDFMAGRYSFAGSGGSVLNQGAISAADGGYVALLGAQVSNQGTIEARLGTVALAAGNKVTLDLAGDSLVSLQVDEGVVDALAQNKQLIRTDGGTALLTAKAAGTLEAAVVNNSGVVEAQTIENHGGVIRLVGDAQNGVAQVGGTLDASAPNGGDGGQVETSAAKVEVAPGAVVTTAAPAGDAGTWLIDPKDYTIAASGGDITGATLSSNLASGNVIIASSGGGIGVAGDINVNDAVSWGADTALTLTASNDINVNAGITATGAASGLNLNANTPNGIDAASGTGSINILNNTVNVAGTVNLTGVDLNVGSAAEFAPSQLLTGDLDASLSGNLNLVAGSGPGITATIASGGTQSISVAGDVVISGGEGSNGIAMIQGNGASQTVSVTGSITATAGGNSSNGSGNKAYILKGGGGMQTVSAYSVQLTGGGGTTGGENKAAILTAPNSSASQQVNIGAGGLSVQAGSGSAAGNTAGIWVLDDYPPANNSATSATQLVSVLGDVAITGGSNATSGNNNASIFQSSTGAGASQTVSVNGSIALTGGATGMSGGAFITSGAPSQTVSAGGIMIHGGGGTDGINNGAGIFQNSAAGAQSVTVNGGGAISITGGSGSAGLNSAQIYSVGSGGQTIEFTSGGAIELTGGTGAIDSGAPGSNYVKIETTAGNQTITGLPSITIQGGTGGGSSGGSNNLGNFALIRADGGAQNIDAGAISLAVPSSGTSSSATIQAPVQTISASSVTLSGGGSVGPFSGARIGGHGGSVGGPTNLTLTTSGPITLTGGTTAGASIGSHAGSATDITIDSGGSVTLTPGTGAGVLIGTPEGTSAGGNISISAQGDIRLDQTGVVGCGIYTSGNVSLFANAGGSIIEQAVSAIQADSLTTVSYGGTMLHGENLVAGFSATNYTNGDIVLNDTVPMLNLVGVGNYATGGSVTIVNGSAIDVTGNVSSANGGDLTLAAGVYVPGDLIIGNPGASVWVTAGTDSANTGDMTLSGSNVRIDGGNGSLPTYVGLTGSGTQRVTTPGDFVVAASASPNGTAFLTSNDSAAQQVNVGGDLQLLGGEGSGNSATLSVNGTGAQTVMVTGTIEAIAGGNSSNGDSNNARIMQNGSGLQTVSANSIVLTGGGGTFGTNNSAAIMTTPNSSASQQVTVGAGGLLMQGGTGSGSGNKAGIWVLDDYSTDHGTSSAQTLTVAGNISLTGGSNADAAVINNNNNNASIFQSSTGVGATQTVTAFGGITLTGGASGANGGAYMSSLAPNQSVSAGSGGIALQGGGGVDGLNDTAAIVQNNFGGSQSVTVGGGGLLSLAGGSGSRGSNSAGIYSVGSGPQTINFATGGALAVAGGSGVPLSTAEASNFARIEATAGDQSITGGPSITIQGGSGGADLVGSRNLGNYAFIRADTGLQSIDAGAIVLSAGASGTNNSATIQGPTQSISATSVAINGGSGGGVFSGSRIGGHGGTFGGPTYLTLTTSGPITLTGGSASGASIGSHAGWTSDIAINAGGDVTLMPGTGAGARIGSPAGSVSGGNISIFSKGNITLGENGGIGSGIYTTGDVSLNVTTGPLGKSIFEAPASAIVANSLTTSSDAGTLLLGTNQIGSFNAANYDSGDVVLNDAVPVLDVTYVWNNGFGGSVNIANSGGIDVTGNVFTADGGDLTLAAADDLLIGNPSTGISVFGGSSPAHTGNLTLSGANIAILGGSGSYNTFVGLSGSGTEQVTTPGNLTITATSSPNGAAYLGAGGSVTQTIDVGGNLALTGGDGSFNQVIVEHDGTGAQNISAGSITLSGGEGANSSAMIMQNGSGVQAVAVDGSIVATAGGNSSNGFGNNAYIVDNGGVVQTVSADSIVLAGGGGASGAGNIAGIAQYNFSGTQSVTVNGGGSISITGGSGTGGANLAQIFSQSGGPQTIAFTGGGSINLTGGTGAPASTASTSNFARIEATAGDQWITGGPSISIQGGSGGTDYVGTRNLGNFAFIRADSGLQSIDAGAITLTAGASGINNSASIQGPTQVINASSVALNGGGGSGGYAGARIGGRGGLAGGPTNLTLTTSGSVTLSGGSSTGVAIGANPSGGGPTNITINAGGDVLLTPGAVAGVRIGSPADLLDGGNISITSQGRIRLNQVGGIGSGIYTTGDVSLTANAVGGRIFVPLASEIVANSLTTVSDEGTFIRGANRVGSFSGTNFSANGVIFYDATPALEVTSIWNNASGGNVYVSNSGDVNVTGNVFASDGGNLSLIAGGDLLIGNPITGISVFAGSGPANTGNMTLEGANIGIFGGTGLYSTSVGLVGSGVQQVTTPGTLTLSASALLNGGVYLTANDSATQSISAGNIALSGGEGVSNAASIVQSGSGSQTVAATGAIVASAGGNSSNGSFNNAYISDSGSGAQSVSANSISLTGGGGISGASNAAGIYKGAAGGTQSITVNGSGAISINGGSGTGGANLAQIYSQSGDPQTITFTSGGAINLEGGTGAPVNTAPTSNFARIEATAGSQSITGAPSISIQGGSDGSDLVGSKNLGNFAFIRADIGPQSIDAGAITLTAGASGFNNSASIQGPTQVISASTVAITGGGGLGSLAGARIGGRGGAVGGPTDLTLVTSGSITLTGGSTTGAGIGADSLLGGSTDIAINAGGDVTLAPGTGAGVRIGSTPSTLAPGTISITSAGNITLGQNGSIGSGIYSAGEVSLTAGGSIAEQPLSKILGNSLTTVSDAGTLLGGPNQVAVFNATNAASGNVSLMNTADPLTITGITNNGGDISVDNTGAIVTTGLISAPAGSVSIVAHSPLTIGAAGVSAGGNISLSAGQTADPGDALGLDGPVASTGGGAIVLYAGDDLLQNADVSSNGGSVGATSADGSITMAAGTTTSSGGGNIGYAAPLGDINLSSLDAGTGAIDLSAGGNIQPTSGYTGVNLTGYKATVSAGGDVTLTTLLRRPAKVTAGGTVSVTKLHPCRDDDSCDDDDRDQDGHQGDDQGSWDQDQRGDGDQGEDR